MSKTADKMTKDIKKYREKRKENSAYFTYQQICCPWWPFSRRKTTAATYRDIRKAERSTGVGVVSHRVTRVRVRGNFTTIENRGTALILRTNIHGQIKITRELFGRLLKICGRSEI